MDDLDSRFRPLDEHGLAALPLADREAQAEARERLWLYVDSLWHAANSTGQEVPPVLDDLRGLTEALFERARQQATNANED